MHSSTMLIGVISFPNIEGQIGPEISDRVQTTSRGLGDHKRPSVPCLLTRLQILSYSVYLIIHQGFEFIKSTILIKKIKSKANIKSTFYASRRERERGINIKLSDFLQNALKLSYSVYVIIYHVLEKKIDC